MKLNLKSVLTGSAATIALLAASSANASGYYVGLFGGISSVEDDFDLASTTSGSASTGNIAISSTWKGTLASGPYVASFTWDPTPYKTTGNATGTSASDTRTGATGEPRFGWNYQRTSVLFGAGTTVFGTNGSFEDGWVVGGSLGWDFGNGWRSELEAAYRSHDVEGNAGNWSATRAYTGYGNTGTWGYGGYFAYTAPTYVGLNTVSGTFFSTLWTQTGLTTGTFKSNFSDSGVAMGKLEGDLETWSFMMNVWYDFDFGDSPIHPFIGGGIGFAHASMDLNWTASATGISNPNGLGSTSASVSYRGNGEATDWGFAYQVGAGLGYDLGNGMMLSAQYRYFNTGAMDLSLADQIEVNLESHNFLVGLNIPLGGGM